MYLDYPDVEEAYTHRDQYLFGEDLLVAPIVRPGPADDHAATRTVWIPEGTWYHWFSGEGIVGPALIETTAALDEIPVWARAGAVVPTQPYSPRSASAPQETLILRCTPAPAHTTVRSMLYEDDGQSDQYVGGRFATTQLEQRTEVPGRGAGFPGQACQTRGGTATSAARRRLRRSRRARTVETMIRSVAMVVVLVAILSLPGCSGSTDSGASESQDVRADTANAETVSAPAEESSAPEADTDEEMDGGADAVANGAPDTSASQSGAREYTTRLEATFLETTVAAGPLNGRDRPGLSGEVVDQLPEGASVIVTGLSERTDFIDDHEGRWVRIVGADDREWAQEPLGWVFSKYIAGAEDLSPREMKVVGLTAPQPGRVQTLRITLDGEQQNAFRHRLDTQDFYTFVWTSDQRGFSYRDIPGAYVWREGQDEADLISHQGSSMESAWVAFTDDFKYMFQDFGTSPGVRGLGVTNVTTGERVYSGGYLGDINLDGYEIDVVVSYSDWRLERGLVDEQTIEHAEAFIEDNPEPTREPGGLFNLLIVNYRLNVDTGQRDYTGAEWIKTQ